MSLGMSFARRRMMAAAKKEPKYVWAVYDFAYVRDDANATTGSFSATRSRTKMAASAYTVNEGGFTLTSPTSTSLQNLQVGQFIVDIGTTSNSTATSGEYLYEVTGKSTSYTTTVQYKRYSVKASKGDTEIDRVESETMDYPVDGEQDGLWYVMLKGEREVFVWDVFAIDSVTIEKQVRSEKRTNGGTFYRHSATLDQKTCIYTVTKYIESFTSTLDADGFYGKPADGRKYWLEGKLAVGDTFTEYIGDFDSLITNGISNLLLKWYAAELTEGKGNALGTEVESADSSVYPQDGIQGDYWYTYSHSYMAEFDDR